MSSTIVTTPLGDSLRKLADMVDQVPALDGARTYPEAPEHLLVGVRTHEVARILAADFGVEATEYQDDVNQTVNVSFTIDAGPVGLHVYAIESNVTARLLRRLADVDEDLIGRDL